MYYGNPVVKQWALASVKFWEKLVSSHGGVAEVYLLSAVIAPHRSQHSRPWIILIHLSQTDQEQLSGKR